MHAKIGGLTLRECFLEGALGEFPAPERQALIDRGETVAVKRQAQPVGRS
jgi:hypothetical protein